MADAQNGAAGIDPRFLNSARGLLALLVPVVAVVGATYSIHAVVANGIRENERGVADVKEDIKREVGRLNGIVERLRDDLDAHRSLGPDGLPHPQGVVRELRDVEEEIDRIKEILDMNDCP